MHLFDSETEPPTLNERTVAGDGLVVRLQGIRIRLTIMAKPGAEEGFPSNAVTLWFDGDSVAEPDVYVRFPIAPPTAPLVKVGPTAYFLYEEMRDGSGGAAELMLSLSAQLAYTPIADLAILPTRRRKSVDLDLRIGPHWRSQKRVPLEKLPFVTYGAGRAAAKGA